jgi:hypothetical protein
MLEQKQKKTQPRFAWLGKNEKGVVTLHGNITYPTKQEQQKITNPNKRVKVPDLRPEAQQQSSVKKILKKIPLVKRAYKRSKVSVWLDHLFHSLNNVSISICNLLYILLHILTRPKKH